MDAYTAAHLLGVDEKRMKHFKVKDPFNPWELEGYISTSEMLYGSMVIFKINDYLTEQIVIGTPKQKYPFDRLGRFKFPSARHISVWEKMDGSNILAYGYKIKKQIYVTYKTRLTPVLTSISKWGNWFEMWVEMLNRYPAISEFSRNLVEHGINASYELFGSRNKHLIEYDIPLDTVFLFAIKNSAESPEIFDPDCFSATEKLVEYEGSLPIVHKEVSIDSSHDLYSWYQKLRGELEAVNKFTEDGSIKGSEGFVWYLEDINSKVHQYKCKPPSIEEIHWAGHISKNSILTTVMNAYESGEEVTAKLVKELLLEEYTEREISLNEYLIQVCMDEVAKRLRFNEKILSLYKELGLNLSENKNETMRILSKSFERNQMRLVYSFLKGMGFADA